MRVADLLPIAKSHPYENPKKYYLFTGVQSRYTRYMASSVLSTGREIVNYC